MHPCIHSCIYAWHDLVMFQTWFGHVSDMIWSCFRHVLAMFQTCFGHVPDMIWSCFRHVLGIIQTCFGHHSDMFWGSSRHVLGIIWTCSGWFVCHFLIIFSKLKKKKKSKTWKVMKNQPKVTNSTPRADNPTRGGPGAAAPGKTRCERWVKNSTLGIFL